jgi:hypothetical protein
MPINFFQDHCRSESSQHEFGLCDDPPPSSDPAYIDENNTADWIAIVKNTDKSPVQFYAIDNCVEMLRPDGSMASRCDGVLSYQDNSQLIFVELKSRRSGQWFKKGREQLTSTINKFKAEYDINMYCKVEAYVCNNLRPHAHSGQAENIQRFKDQTGLILKGSGIVKLG